MVVERCSGGVAGATGVLRGVVARLYIGRGRSSGDGCCWCCGVARAAADCACGAWSGGRLGSGCSVVRLLGVAC